MRPKIFFLCLILPLSTLAQIITDDTLGPIQDLQGPDYQIEPDLGQQQGGHLFHSFQAFNLQSHETATFSGPSSIQNVISRVTGGHPSNIDGLIRSTIPNADMYFLNPYGILFGPHAKLEVQGSFHASTADYLRLGKEGHFNARYPSDSILTIAPIESFGFLTDSPAAITTQESQLAVPNTQTLSLIGGDLDLSSHFPILFDEQRVMNVSAHSQLSAPAGQINLASVASQGEVIPSEFGLDLKADGGQVTASHTLIDVNGQGGGRVFIRGEQLIMQDSSIQANTLAEQNGKDIDLEFTESVNINGDILALSNATFGQGHAGDIVIKVPNLNLIGSMLDGSSFNIGHAGDVKIEAEQVLLDKGSVIASDAFVDGNKSGNIHISANSISLNGQRKGIFIIPDHINKIDNATQISSDTYGTKQTPGEITITAYHLKMSGGLIGTNGYGKAKTGQITVKADTVDLTGGALISTTAFAGGEGGEIQVVADTVSIKERREGLLIVSGGVFENNQSGLVSLTFREGSAGDILVSSNTLILENEGSIAAATFGEGNAGDVVIETNNFYLLNGGQINNSNSGFVGEQMLIGRGHGGVIQVNVRDNLTISGQSERGLSSGLFTNTGSTGQGGNIEVKANHLKLSEGGEIAAKSFHISHAGEIIMQANRIDIMDESRISTSAEQAVGGNMTIMVPNLLVLQQGEITTSVHGGGGDGGNITIENPAFVVLNQGKIKAQADEGHGGNIRIVAEQFIQSYKSLISASSRLGLDGEVNIDSPTVDLSSALLTLTTDFNVSSELKPPCSLEQVAQAEQRYHFAVKSMTGSPPSPYDWKANRLVLLPVSAKKTNSVNARPPRKNVPTSFLLAAASLIGCQPNQ